MRFASPAVLLLTCLAASGCATGFYDKSPAAPSTLGAIQGQVHGGRQPVSGAHIYVYAAGVGGYGTASTSLLTSFSTGSFPTTIDGNGHYYVTTNAGGSFGLTGEYTCTPGTQVYLYSVGGDPGIGSTNSAAGFLAILGNCPAGGTLASQTPTVFMSEVSTVAAAYAFAGFATDATHVASSGTALAQMGIANAFANAVNLYDISVNGSARAKPAYVGGTSPQAEVNSLANSLAACVNSTGSTSTQCSALFTNIKSAGATGTTATDTATEAIYIAHNPATAVGTIFTNPVGIGAPFQPVLGSAPNDWTMEVNYYDGELGFPDALAIDGSGNVWVTSYDTAVSKYSPVGQTLSVTAYVGGGLKNPTGIAIDTNGNAWVANNGGSVVSEFGPTGTPASANGFAGNGHLNPYGIAIDGGGNIWVSNFSQGTLTKMNTSGVEASGSPFALSGLSSPANIAIDHAGNAWVGTYNGGTAIVKATTTGTAATGSPYTSGSYNGPRSLAVDSSGGVWVANSGDTTLVHATSAGVGTNFSGNAGGASAAYGLAIDGLGNVWTISNGNNHLSEFTSAGAAISPSTGYRSADVSSPFGLAIDGSGNVWVVNGNGDTLSSFIGAAAPTITPTVAAVIGNTIGTRP